MLQEKQARCLAQAMSAFKETEAKKAGQFANLNMRLDRSQKYRDDKFDSGKSERKFFNCHRSIGMILIGLGEK
jgi:hypothetical protein